jgi:hypothetical protein
MYILIPVIFLLTFPILGIIIYDIIRRKSRPRRFILSAIALVFIGLITWYLIPTKYELPDSENLSIHIVFPLAHKDIAVTEPEQKDELLRLVRELRVEREFLSSNREKSFDGTEYVYMAIHGHDNETDKPFLLGLHMTLNDSGFLYGDGNCFDNNYSNIKNPQRLIAYVRSLMAASQGIL